MKKQSASILVSLLALPILGGCSKDLAGSELLDMGVTANGIILQTSAQSCVDKSTTVTGAPPTRSLTAPSLYFTGFSVTWKSADLDLYIGEIQVTVTSPHISTGKMVVQLDPTEVEALLGATNATLVHEVVSGTARTYSSTSINKDKSSAGLPLASCGLGIGGITLATVPAGATVPQFIAQVKIDLIGSASNSSDPNSAVKTVLKTLNTTATYYN